jgi:hypothetical protein
MRRILLTLSVLACGCSQRSQIALDYQLDGIDLMSVVRVETYLQVAPGDPRGFFADQPYREVATGVGYEVRDFDGSGVRKMLITHDSTLGFMFQKRFTFTLLPPAGETAPMLEVTARAVGASSMLGRTDALKTHFGAGVHLEVALSDTRCSGVACTTDQQCCNMTCTSVSTDAQNCGGCGNACAPSGDSCQGGTCLCAGGSTCDAPRTCCALLGCVDLTSDPFNCGACGNACNPGETCVSGSCACDGGAACGAGGLCCKDTGCSSTGSCPCGASACNSPNTCCDDVAGTCVDEKTDNANCGGCGVTCASPLSCANGACACNGQICSGGSTCCSTGCANLQSSTANCGACGHACAANESCMNGQCQCGSTTCSSSQSCCGGTCASTMSDPMNCGGCGLQCNAGEQCVSGHCQCPGTSPPRACTATETCCGGGNTSSGGGCFDLSADHGNCGQCGHACGGASQCIQGSCVQTGCSPPCTNGNSCDPTTLQCVCSGSSNACSGNTTCCAGSGCFDLSSTQTNCGTCGNDVTPDFCCGGTRTPHGNNNCTGCGQACSFGSICCADPNGKFGCVTNDVNNCGACGNTCPPRTNMLQIMCCACGPQGMCSQLCPVGPCVPPPSGGN